VVGGFVYEGSSAPDPRGKYLFSHIVPGRVFYADTRQIHSGGKSVTVYELALFTDGAQPATMQRGTRKSIRGFAPVAMVASTCRRRQTARSGKSSIRSGRHHHGEQVSSSRPTAI
jgi:hypothetical protein